MKVLRTLSVRKLLFSELYSLFSERKPSKNNTGINQEISRV